MKIKHTPASDSTVSFLSSVSVFQKALENLFNNAEGGFTMALTGPWGSGKTTFVHNWIPALRDKGFKVIYLNAWESDFIASPQACLLGELKLALGALAEEKELADLADRSFLNDLDSKKSASRVLDAVTTADCHSLLKEIDEYDQLRKTLVRFRELLQASVKDKKVVFFVDELDRCRPDYAVRVLEIIKHLFSVDGIIFVAVIDKSHLCESVKGFYGSEGLDSSDYLRRFFEIELSLPSPSYENYCKYLCDYYGISDFFDSPLRQNSFEFKDDKGIFITTSVYLAKGKRLTFRQMERLFSYLRVVLLTLDHNQYVFPDVLLLLLYLKQFNPATYDSLSSGTISVNDTVACFESEFSDLFTLCDKSTNHYFHYTFVCFLRFYENYRESGTYFGIVRSRLYDKENKRMLVPCSRVTEERMVELLTLYERKMDNVNMGNIFKNISLLNNYY